MNEFIDSMVETLRPDNYFEFIKTIPINQERIKKPLIRVAMRRVIDDDDEADVIRKSREERGILTKPNMRNYISIRLEIDTDDLETIPIKSIEDIIYTREELEKMRVVQLDSILTSLGIKPTGSKNNKLNLIISYYQQKTN